MRDHRKMLLNPTVLIPLILYRSIMNTGEF
jgi:hypothetical protein